MKIIPTAKQIVNKRKGIIMKKADKTELTKQRILKAAVEEFGTYGYDGATVNNICSRHNISKGLIYHNFENKGALYLVCVETAVDEFIAYMSEFQFGTDFHKYMEERYKFFHKNQNFAHLIFSATPPSEDKEFTNALQNIRKRFDAFNAQLYLSALDSLHLRAGVTKEDALQYYGLLQDMLNSYTSINGRTDGFKIAIDNREKNLYKILDYMLYGIAEEQK